MRRMNQKTALLLSLFFGLATALIVYYFVNSQKAKSAVAERRVNVVVARADIAPRTPIRFDMVEFRSVPESERPEGAQSDFNGIQGKVSSQLIPHGTAITPLNTLSSGPELGLAFNVKPNMRAQTVPIDPVSGVAGFLKPGDHVDVLATYTVQSQVITRTVLQDVELLAIGSQVTTTSNNKKDNPNESKADDATATLAVPVSQMQPLALAAQKSKLQLVLRNYGDHTVVPPTSTTGYKVFGISEGTPTAQPAPQGPAARPSEPITRAPAMEVSPSRQATPTFQPIPPLSRAPQTHSIEVTRGETTSTVQVPQ